MGQGIQQPSVQQDGGNAFLDVFKVLFEPTAVFERVRERPRFLAPFIVICALQIAIYFYNLPFMKVGMAAQMANRSVGGPDLSKFLFIGALFIPVGIGIVRILAAAGNHRRDCEGQTERTPLSRSHTLLPG